ncbi:Protein CBG20887 [Caenorhabditis briggsae]|uniref:Protein CBG20887 n=1 Tax=Caenorhabditis briggsae TaxID=6238 RepID=A8XYV7_CAEBR|nr:Protein CBG20887 [Caenorhabditis briggsae]CAP37824.2 Protein CBG20887 [Caenorhabditis briggsae]
MRKNRDATSTSSGGSSTMMQHRGSITQCSGIGSIGLPILGGRGRGVMSDSHMQRTFNEAMRQRRTSLPANSLSLNGTKSLITGSSLSEAKGLIADMLMNKELPGNVATCLRAVATLLEQRPLPINGLLSEYGLPSVIENPYGGESMVIGYPSPNSKFRYSLKFGPAWDKYGARAGDAVLGRFWFFFHWEVKNRKFNGTSLSSIIIVDLL